MNNPSFQCRLSHFSSKSAIVPLGIKNWRVNGINGTNNRVFSYALEDGYVLLEKRGKDLFCKFKVFLLLIH